MGYDIRLVDPVTREPLHSDAVHDMRGCTYAINGTTELWLSITYNYSNYYYEATEGDQRFANENKYGIRGIYGKSGAMSIPMLQDMIARIDLKYKDSDGNWLITHRERQLCFDESGKRIDLFEAIHNGIKHTIKTEEYEISEGDTSDYWESTAANALRPLYQLIAMAQLRPDGIWEGD